MKRKDQLTDTEVITSEIERRHRYKVRETFAIYNSVSFTARQMRMSEEDVLNMVKDLITQD